MCRRRATTQGVHVSIRSKFFLQPIFALVLFAATAALAADAKGSRAPATQEMAVDASASEVIIVRGDKRFLVDLAAGSVREVGAAASAAAPQQAGSSSSKDASAQAAADTQQQPADTQLTYYVPGDVRLMTV